ncbi:transcription cofactor vestigial-like protein 2a [Hippocampus comes]|uniref:Vestigial-like family member 2a n=1 Tax=Hippocampus comes TaxID=109280 RepID=A0A3Q3DDL3_HIPCM|nr:PREDICTED: transcription cofactor vestigial-like protein 2 [Hippocampus comes]
MSCLDVMYQVLGAQSYFSPYMPYQYQQQKLTLDSKMQEPQHGGGAGRLGPPGPPTIKEEDKELPPGAEYLSSRCVLFTYFHGDISAVVDQHFSRALSHASSSTSYPPSSHKTLKDGSFPMSQRNFPPSFWNSSYPSPVPSSLASALSAPHSELAFAAGDPYAPSSLHGHLHQPGPDAWHPSHPHHPHHHPYPLGGGISAQGSPYSRPAVHEVYGAAFDPRYGSLLVPSVRSHHRLASGGGSVGPAGGAHCDLGGKGEAAAAAAAWSGTFSGVGEIGLNMDAGLQTQDKSKDLYWF